MSERSNQPGKGGGPENDFSIAMATLLDTIKAICKEAVKLAEGASEKEVLIQLQVRFPQLTPGMFYKMLEAGKNPDAASTSTLLEIGFGLFTSDSN